VRATKKRLVVIGNGMVGHRFCEKLIAFDTTHEYTITVLGEEPRVAYDRVNLSAYFSGTSAEELSLVEPGWYEKNDITLLTGTRATFIDRKKKTIQTDQDQVLSYDTLVLATGSAPFVPPVPGIEKEGVFVYRTIEDLEAMTEFAGGVEKAAVIGGGLLGLEAAKALVDLNLNTTVVEFASRLMPRQLNQSGSEILVGKIESLGVQVLLDHATERVLGNGSVAGLKFTSKTELDVGMIVVSAGIRPRDELAKECGLKVGERGGVVVDDGLVTSDPDIFAIGEVALHNEMIYGLVAPGYQMAENLAYTLTGSPKTFTSADMSTKLKLLGVDVAAFGDPFTKSDNSRSVEFRDAVKGVYKSVTVSLDGNRVLGGMLVGEADEYARLLHLSQTGEVVEGDVRSLILGSRGGAESSTTDLPDAMQVCSCNNVSKGAIVEAIHEEEIRAIGPLKACTQAGTGCGGCMPLVTKLLDRELEKLGCDTKKVLCSHFEYTRQELFQIVRVKKIKTFRELIDSRGTGNGCEICKPAVSSILASLWVEHIGNTDHESLQDTNDRFFANIQRQGTYSVVPRVPGGEITPDKLIVLGQVAKEFNLYTKITGGQRIDLFGAHVSDLPKIWAELIAAGFESGHAYGKALRTVKSCVGSSWCRFGVQDSVTMAIDIENRYKGIRAPHKIKMAVSGCVRECAEAQCKDIGLIATDKGWNLYVCGNGGAKPRHADLFATDLDTETAVRYIDRVLMYYIHTADRLMRTAPWMENLEGGLKHLQDVVINDSLKLCGQLEEDMNRLIDSYECEWTAVVNDPEKQKRFTHFSKSAVQDDKIEFVDERGQKRPIDWSTESWKRPVAEAEEIAEWVPVGRVTDFPVNGGSTIQYGTTQIAVFNFTDRDEWFATQNMCPHKKDMVLARGIIGDHENRAYVSCPMHKKTFDLENGSGMSDPALDIMTFPVKVEQETVYARLLPAESLAAAFADASPSCAGSCATT
jgi:nitrite reductase (NADH) large subunit